MNLKGEYHGIKWIGFVRQRQGRRKTFALKYSVQPGEWPELTAPRDVTSESKFRAWAIDELDLILRSGERPKQGKSATSVRELYEKWIALREQDKVLAGVTVRGNRTAFKSQILATWGDVPVLALENKRAELRGWVREVAGRVSPIRCHNVVSAFRTFLTACRLENWVPLRSNPLKCEEVESVLPPLPKKRDVVTLPIEVVQALLDCADVEYRRAVRYAVAVCTGAADGELAGCRVSDVLDLEGDLPRLRILRAYKTGARRRQDGSRRWAELGPPKNDYRKRAIPLSDCARDALQDWLAEGWEHWVGRPPEPNDPLFPSRHGEFSRPAFAKLIREDLEAAEQPKIDASGRLYEFRALRRTFSTTLRKCKVDRELREQLMGQSSNSVNTDHYTDEVPEELFDAVRRLPFRWTRRPPVSSGKRSMLEPTAGFEPATCSLRKNCSTTELSRRAVVLGGALGAALGGANQNSQKLVGNSNGEQRFTKALLYH